MRVATCAKHRKAMRCDAKFWRCAFSLRKSSAMRPHDAKTLAMRCRDASHSGLVIVIHCASRNYTWNFVCNGGVGHFLPKSRSNHFWPHYIEFMKQGPGHYPPSRLITSRNYLSSQKEARAVENKMQDRGKHSRRPLPKRVWIPPPTYDKFPGDPWAGFCPPSLPSLVKRFGAYKMAFSMNSFNLQFLVVK